MLSQPEHVRDESTFHPDMRVSFEAVCTAAKRVSSSDIRELEALSDELYAVQPAALGHCIVLSRQGFPEELVDHPFHLLMVYHEACKEAGITVPPIDESTLEEAWETIDAKCRYLEGETTQAGWERAINLDVDSHPETCLLAYTVGYLRDHNLVGGDKELLLRAVFALLEAYRVNIHSV